MTEEELKKKKEEMELERERIRVEQKLIKELPIEITS